MLCFDDDCYCQFAMIDAYYVYVEGLYADGGNTQEEKEVEGIIFTIFYTLSKMTVCTGV